MTFSPRLAALLGFSLVFAPLAALAAPGPVQTFTTSAGPVKITPIYHAAAMIEAGGDRIYIDPAKPADIRGLPPGDLILITDIHGDHMDADDIKALSKEGTKIIAPAAVQATITTAQNPGLRFKKFHCKSGATQRTPSQIVSATTTKVPRIQSIRPGSAAAFHNLLRSKRASLNSSHSAYPATSHNSGNAGIRTGENRYPSGNATNNTENSTINPARIIKEPCASVYCRIAFQSAHLPESFFLLFHIL